MRVLVKAGVKIDAGEFLLFFPFSFLFLFLLSLYSALCRRLPGAPFFLAHLSHSPSLSPSPFSLSLSILAGDGNGNTALHYAAGYNQPECVMELLAAGADPSKKNNEGKSPALVAKLNGSDEIAEMLGGEDYDGEEDGDDAKKEAEKKEDAEKKEEEKDEEKKDEDKPEEKK